MSAECSFFSWYFNEHKGWSRRHQQLQVSFNEMSGATPAQDLTHSTKVQQLQSSCQSVFIKVTDPQITTDAVSLCKWVTLLMRTLQPLLYECGCEWMNVAL